MRLLEIVIPLVLVIYLLWPHPRPRVIWFAPVFALALTLLHFFVEGYRWQMIPLYVLTLLLTISSLAKIKTSSGLVCDRFILDPSTRSGRRLDPARCFDSFANPAACPVHSQAGRTTCKWAQPFSN